MSAEVAIRHTQGDFTLDVAFSAAAGGVTALFGPSGSGKSSIVHVLAGLIRPDRGRIVLEGRTVLDTEAGIFVPPEKRRASLVFQDARLFPHMSVEKNLLFGWRRSAVRAGEAEIARIIALLASPDILLLDEPLASLDASRRGEILPWLERLRDIARIPIFYVSHALDEVARLADRVVLLDAGRVTAEGSVFELLAGLGAEKPLGAVLEATGDGAANGLCRLVFDGGELLVAEQVAPGKRVRVRIGADEILVAREAPHAISANNILPVVISGVRLEGTRAEVAMRCGKARLVARITAASAQRLQLAAGIAAFAVIKSVIVEGS